MKGPIGLLLPGLVVLVWWLVRGEGGRWRELPGEGVVLYAAVGLSWYLVEAVLHGASFLRTIVGFYSIAGTKLPNYVLPVYPIAAIAAARLWRGGLWDDDAEAGPLLRW